MENKIEYLSLYDFLGKPAGGELGREVAQAASKAGVKLETREVSTPNYTGIVYLYPKDFLEFYFREPEPNFWTDTLPGELNYNIEDDDLPF
jgi:hypothetical protein